MSDSNAPAPAAALVSQETEVTAGKVEMLVSVRSAGNLNPAARTVSVLDTLNAMPDVEIVRSIKASGSALFSAGPAGNNGDVIVARTTMDRLNALQVSAAQTTDVVIEINHRLIHLGAIAPQLNGPPPTGLSPAVSTSLLKFKILGDKNQPLAKVTIMIWGTGFPVSAETDTQGTVDITFTGTVDTVQAVYVKPSADFWERFIWNPVLDVTGVNKIVLQPLAAFQPANFGQSPFLGWGQRAMGLDQNAASGLTGKGVRIGIVDSGCDTSHPALSHITIGRDYTNLDSNGNPSDRTWTNDTVSHGTHCAGVIAGNGLKGIRGFAPSAEVHILKLFEGGAFDSLIKALKYAIDNQIHVINCSLGGTETSEIVTNWMQQARQAGVAVVVAAGNSSGPVQFPGSLPSVLCVSAVGRQGEFPLDTYHAQTLVQNAIGVNGYFGAKFSCFGPQVKVTGPGVAIISSVPGGGYAAWDGTSMAAPHLTGLTALIAAHHPAFANIVVRDAAWVDRLFQTVVTASTDLSLNAALEGAGLPSLINLFGAQPVAGPTLAVAPSVPQGLEASIRQSVVAAIQQFTASHNQPLH
jgi:subtilisin